MRSGEARGRSISVEGLYNARDLGGLELISGGRTPYGVFFRSDCPHQVTATGWERIRELGIRTVVDLRQPTEQAKQAYDPPAWSTIVTVDHDGLDDHPEFWSGYWNNGLVATALYYQPHLQQLPQRSAAALAAIADAPEGGVLFHCAGGRDRTGIIAMLLLAIAGATPDAIAEDYMQSVRNADALEAARGVPSDEPEREALCREHGTTTEGAFRQVVQQLDLAAIKDLVGEQALRRLTTWRGSLA